MKHTRKHTFHFNFSGALKTQKPRWPARLFSDWVCGEKYGRSGECRKVIVDQGYSRTFLYDGDGPHPGAHANTLYERAARLVVERGSADKQMAKRHAMSF